VIAQQLTMFPYFPLDLCVLALERCHDDLSFAASWLIENGNQVRAQCAHLMSP
jgi:hypothetical protein